MQFTIEMLDKLLNYAHKTFKMFNILLRFSDSNSPTHLVTGLHFVVNSKTNSQLDKG